MQPPFYSLGFQNRPLSIISKVNSSSLPATIDRDNMNLLPSENRLKVFAGPTAESPGPMFPIQDAAALRFVSIS